MGYPSRTSAQIIFQILFYLTAVNSQAQIEPILNVTTIRDGKPFTITCAANRVMSTSTDPFVDDLYGLEVNLDTPAHPNMNSIAQYHPSAKGPNMQFTNVTTPGWTVMFSGNTSTGNRQTLKIEVVVQSAVCADAGLYRCLIQYLNNGLFKSPNMTQNVTAEADTTEPILSLQPLKSEASSFSNYSMYDLGEKVIMTCRVKGPPNMVIVWRQERRPSFGSATFQDYPFQKDIDSEHELVAGSSAACKQFQYVSRLTFNVSDEDTKRVYQCVIQDNGVDSLTVSATIDLIPVTASPDTVNKNNPKAAATNMIIGIVVGCVSGFVILIIIILCVVCHRRSKNKNNGNSSANHPDSYESQPPYPSVPARNAYGDNSHSGYSVPAGKINRGLDASFESNNKPPHVYTIENNNEAPRRPNVDMKYVNLGYDETKPSIIARSPPPISPKPPVAPKPSVAPKPQNIEIANIRRYSTEDETDDHGYSYGNEDFGTNV